ncbi:MAG: DUF2235 domain-containing protein [Nitrospirae bacterium]|nr:DUF2235 domain-containing protein [Nitrospirota bacterium]MEC4672059.1 DUF2235 domain-containing protein [Nitrospirota bacterium]
MALYAFDGTGNKDNPGDGKDTNVLKFSTAYQDGYRGSGDCFYVEGVGTRWGIVGKFLGSIFGAGGQKRVREAMKALKRNFNKGDTRIDIIGFSRGAALALEFANEILEEGVHGVKEPPIRFLGIWDTVASFGIPGNNINLGFHLTVPSNVGTCCHAIALDERRFSFPLTRVVQNAYTGRKQRNIREVWFRGYHSDVGGGNSNQGLSSISLTWMFGRAKTCQIRIPDLHFNRHAALRKPDGPCKKPGMDLKANKKRSILLTDVVHESVSRRKMAGAFRANNPPKGLHVAGDNGKILRKRFR